MVLVPSFGSTPMAVSSISPPFASPCFFFLPLLIKSGRVILGLKKLKGKGKGAGGQVGQ